MQNTLEKTQLWPRAHPGSRKCRAHSKGYRSLWEPLQRVGSRNSLKTRPEKGMGDK